MAEVEITQQPNLKVTNLSMTRDGYAYTVSWTIPDKMTNDDNPARAESFWIYWNIKKSDGRTFMPTFTNTLNNAYQIVDTKTTSVTYTLTPELYHPQANGNIYVVSIQAWVGVHNSKCPVSKAGVHAPVQITSAPLLTLSKPPAPYFSGATSYTATGEDAGAVKQTIAIANTKGATTQHRRCVRLNEWTTKRINGKITQSRKQTYTNAWVIGDDHDSDSSDTVTYAIERTYADTAFVLEGDYYKYEWQIDSAGIAGNSASSRHEFYVAYPAMPTINNVSYSAIKNGSINLLVNSNRTVARPTETMQAQYQWADEKKNLTETGWKDIGEDYGWRVTGIPLEVADFGDAEIEKHLFVRVQATGQTRICNSLPYQLSDTYFYLPTSRGDADTKYLETLSVTADDKDLTALNVVVGYTPNSKEETAGGYAYNATEISYSTDQQAWTSTSQPTTYEMPDKDWQDETSKSTKHTKTSTIKISGLDENTMYYVRARRYVIDDKDNKHSAWSVQEVDLGKTKGTTGYYVVDNLTLSTSTPKVAVDAPCQFSWTFESDKTQTSWALKDASNNATLINGNDSVTSCSYSFAETGVKSLYLSCTFNNGQENNTLNSPITVNVVEPAVLTYSIAPASELTSYPYTFTVTADDAEALIDVRILSEGIDNELPDKDGSQTQYKGDVVYSTTGTGTVAVSLDSNYSSRFIHNCRYKIVVSSTLEGVESKAGDKYFTVNYPNKPSAINDSDITISTDTTNRQIRVKVQNMASGCSWNLYRKTKDGRAVKMTGDFANGDAPIDRYAPYTKDGVNELIVAVKTTEGVVASQPFTYTLKCSNLRFDWDGKSVEVPYNLSISDGTDKQFEQQLYLDGSQKGSWGASVVRTASLSTDLIYIEDEEKLELIRELARYQGAVFVRTPLGQAYCANVEVDEVSKEYDSKVMAVSFDVTEIDCTEEFKTPAYASSEGATS